MENKPGVKKMMEDLYDDNGLSKKKSKLTDEFVEKVDSYYEGDYAKLLNDFYDDNNLTEKKEKLTDEFMGQVLSHYGLKKKEKTFYPEQPEVSSDLSGQSEKPLEEVLAGTSSPSESVPLETPSPSPSPEGGGSDLNAEELLQRPSEKARQIESLRRDKENIRYLLNRKETMVGGKAVRVPILEEEQTRISQALERVSPEETVSLSEEVQGLREATEAIDGKIKRSDNTGERVSLAAERERLDARITEIEERKRKEYTETVKRLGSIYDKWYPAFEEVRERYPVSERYDALLSEVTSIQDQIRLEEEQAARMTRDTPEYSIVSEGKINELEAELAPLVEQLNQVKEQYGKRLPEMYGEVDYMFEDEFPIIPITRAMMVMEKEKASLMEDIRSNYHTEKTHMEKGVQAFWYGQMQNLGAQLMLLGDAHKLAENEESSWIGRMMGELLTPESAESAALAWASRTLGEEIREWGKEKSEPLQEYLAPMADSLGEFEWNHLLKRDWWVHNLPGLSGSAVWFGTIGLGSAALTGGTSLVGATGWAGLRGAIGKGAVSSIMPTSLMGMSYAGTAYEDVRRRGGTEDEAIDAGFKTFWSVIPSTFAMNSVQLGLAYSGGNLTRGITGAPKYAAKVGRTGSIMSSGAIDNYVQEYLTMRNAEQALGGDPMSIIEWAREPEGRMSAAAGLFMPVPHIFMGGINSMVRGQHVEGLSRHSRGVLVAQDATQGRAETSRFLLSMAVEEGRMTQSQADTHMSAVESLVVDEKFKGMTGEAAVEYSASEVERQGLLRQRNDQSKKDVEKIEETQDGLAYHHQQNEGRMNVLRVGEELVPVVDGQKLPVSRLTDKQKSYYDYVVEASERTTSLLAKEAVPSYELVRQGELTMFDTKEEFLESVEQAERGDAFVVRNDDETLGVAKDKLGASKNLDKSEKISNLRKEPSPPYFQGEEFELLKRGEPGALVPEGVSNVTLYYENTEAIPENIRSMATKEERVSLLDDRKVKKDMQDNKTDVVSVSVPVDALTEQGLVEVRPLEDITVIPVDNDALKSRGYVPERMSRTDREWATMQEDAPQRFAEAMMELMHEGRTLLEPSDIGVSNFEQVYQDYKAKRMTPEVESAINQLETEYRERRVDVTEDAELFMAEEVVQAFTSEQLEPFIGLTYREKVDIVTENIENYVKDIYKEKADSRAGAGVEARVGESVPGGVQEAQGAGVVQEARAESEGVVASFDMALVDPESSEGKLSAAREQLGDFFRRRGKELGLTDKQWANYASQASRVSTPEAAQRLIDKMLEKSTEMLQRGEVNRRREEIREAVKLDAMKNKLAEARMKSPSEKSKRVKEVTKQWRKDNEARLKMLPRNVREMVDRRMDGISLSPHATTNSLERVVNFLDKVLTDQAYVDSINRIGQKLSKVKGVKGDVNSLLGMLPEMNVKAKHLYGQSDVRTLLSNIDISHEAFTDPMLQSLDRALDGLMPKRGQVQQAQPLIDFLREYHESVARYIDDNTSTSVATEQTAETIRGRVNRMKDNMETLEKGMADGTTTVQELREASANISRLESEINQLYREGGLSESEMKVQNEALESLSDILNEDFGGLLYEARSNYKQALKEYKQDVIGWMPEVSLTDQPVMQREGDVVNTDMQYFKNRSDALDWVRVSDVDYMRMAIPEMNRTGIVPDRFFDVQQRLRIAVTADTYRQLYERMGSVKSTYEKRLEALSSKKLAPVYTTRMDIFLGTEGKDSSPYWENVGFDHKSMKQRADKQTLEDMMSIDKQLKAALKTGMREQLFTTKLSRKQELTMNRIGHVWKNLREYHNRTVPEPLRTETGWIIPKEEGHNEGYSPPVFSSKEKAREHFESNKEQYVSGLDLIHEDIRNNRLKPSNVFAKNRGQNEYKRGIYLEAYEQVRGESPMLIVRSREDAARLLNKEEYALMESMMGLFAKKRGQARVTALREGKSLDYESNYMPFFGMTPEGRVSSSIADALELPLTSYMEQGANVKPPNSIYEKQARTEYVVNSNVLNVMERYINHLNTSYYLLPTMRSQLGAFTAWKSRYERLGKQESPDKPMYDRLKHVSEALYNDLKSRYERDVTYGGLFGSERIGIGGSNWFVDISSGIEGTRKVARTVALVDVWRPFLDLIPQETRQFMEQGLSGFRPKRSVDLIPLYDYTPDGSFAKEFSVDMMNRYQNLGDRSVRMTVSEEYTQWYLSQADRISRQQAWTTKFDQVYAQLAGETIDMDMFQTDASYRNEVVSGESFLRAVKMADQYQSKIHFADSPGAAGGETFFGTLKYGTKGYALFTPLSSYMLNQYHDAKMNFHLLLKGSGSEAWMSSKDARVKAGRGLAGSFVNTLTYTYLATLVRQGMKIASHGLDGREDLAEEEREQLKQMYTWEGVASNAVSSAFAIIQSGGAQLGASLLTLVADAGEAYWLKGIKDPIRKRAVKETLTSLRKSAGVIQYRQFDFEREQVGTRTVANLMFPVGGTYMYDVMDGIGSGARYLSRPADLNVPMREDEQFWEFMRATMLIGVGALRGFPGVKDIDRFLKTIEKSARTEPFSLPIEDARTMMGMKETIEREVQTIASNPHLLWNDDGTLRKEDDMTYADMKAREYVLSNTMKVDGMDGSRTYNELVHGVTMNQDGRKWLDDLYRAIKESAKLDYQDKFLMYEQLEPMYERLRDGVWNSKPVDVWSGTEQLFEKNLERELYDEVDMEVSKFLREAKLIGDTYKK